MKTIILNRYSEQTLDYTDALKGINKDFLFITREKHKDVFLNFFNERVTFSDFHKDQNILNYLETFCKNDSIESLVTSHEFDIEKAAFIREQLGIPGQSLESALSFRDKVVMKEKLQGVVLLPKFKKVTSGFDVHHFIKENGFPFIIKPIDGAGSVGFYKFSNLEDWDNFEKSQLHYPLVAEEFIAGDMFHLDGLYKNGEIQLFSSGMYINGCLAFKENNYNGSILVDEQSPLFKRLKKEVGKVLNALDTPSHAITFHAEFFLTNDNKLIFCEIGCRVGGGRINEVFELKYGVNLMNESIRAQCCDDYELSNHTSCYNNKSYGWMLVPPKEGILVSIEENIPFNWVKLPRYRTYKIGKKLQSGDSSVSDYVSAVIEGTSFEEVRQRMDVLYEWFETNTVWNLNSEGGENNF